MNARSFVHAFASFSGTQVATLYFVPGIALRGDGSIECLLSRDRVERFFQTALDSYHRDGCRACRFKDLDVLPLGGRSAVGTVTWELLGHDGPATLTPLVPAGTELDRWGGATYVSIVGFRFVSTRLLGVCVPCHVDFHEVNLRFYVRRRCGTEWRRGVVFVSEYGVEHPPWRVWEATDARLTCDAATLHAPAFAEALGVPPTSAFLAEGSPVTVYRPGRLLRDGDPLRWAKR